MIKSISALVLALTMGCAGSERTNSEEPDGEAERPAGTEVVIAPEDENPTGYNRNSTMEREIRPETDEKSDEHTDDDESHQ